MSKPDFKVFDVTLDQVVLRYEFDFVWKEENYHGILVVNVDENSEEFQIEDSNGEEVAIGEIMTSEEEQELIQQVCQ